MKTITTTFTSAILTLSLLLGLLSSGQAQINLDYQVPPASILDLADAPLPPFIRINEDASKAVLIGRSQYKSISELSEEELRLAGLRISPVTNIGSRTRYGKNLTILDVESGNERQVTGIPNEARLANFTWSPDYSMIAFTNTTTKGVELWMADIESATAKSITDDNLNANIGSPFYWMSNSKTLIVKVLPENKPDLISSDNTVPSGPTISVNDGKKAQNRTYQDLLKNTNDEHNFEILATSVLKKVTVKGKVSDFKGADMYRNISRSPDGKYLLVTTIKKPFSYLVPYRRFPSNTSVYDVGGDLVKSILDVPLIEDLPQGFMSVRTGPRSFSWRADKPSTLVWTVAQDGGDANLESEYRDAVYQHAAPFKGDKEFLIKTKGRYYGMDWGNDDFAIANDYWWNDRNTKSYIFSPSNPDQAPKTIIDRNYQDRYNDPGSIATTKNEYGRNIIDLEGDLLYMIGDGYSDEGKFPFVDTYNIKSGETNRIFQVEASDKVEDLRSPINLQEGTILTRIESQSEYPNFAIRNIKTGELKPVTRFENPFLTMQDIHKEVINYKRDDGLDLSATLYLPVGYDMNSGEKLPMIMWAYPVEYKDKSSAGQVTSSANEFTFPFWGSPLYWVTRGYAVLDDTAFPIVGEGDDQPNDSFRKQLVANAAAAIDAVDKLGYVDRDRVAVGGHSYGAFMTANLLSHSNLFAAGIARSGAYNRTLTPFGFQSEERNYWEGPEVYYNMSPFMHADKMKTPLLLIHGEADNNSGTYPMQSERYFNALKGLGATVRLVMLPKESHGYAAKESILHMLWEQDEWLEKYVKNKADLEEMKE
jgi:dipeptidyl aminopeptidase/acylaminoacyl peptidase